MSAAPDDSEIELKRRFATELVRHRNAWAAADATFPGDVLRAIHVEHNWPFDPVVSEHVRKLQSQTNLTILPTKEDTARELWKIGKEPLPDQPRVDVKDRLTALKLYAELMEYMPKPDRAGATIQVNGGAPSVLKVTDFGSPEQWQEKARYQQRLLIEQAHGIPSDASRH